MLKSVFNFLWGRNGDPPPPLPDAVAEAAGAPARGGPVDARAGPQGASSVPARRKRGRPQRTDAAAAGPASAPAPAGEGTGSRPTRALPRRAHKYWSYESVSEHSDGDGDGDAVLKAEPLPRRRRTRQAAAASASDDGGRLDASPSRRSHKRARTETTAAAAGTRRGPLAPVVEIPSRRGRPSRTGLVDAQEPPATAPAPATTPRRGRPRKPAAPADEPFSTPRRTPRGLARINYNEKPLPPLPARSETPSEVDEPEEIPSPTPRRRGRPPKVPLPPATPKGKLDTVRSPRASTRRSNRDRPEDAGSGGADRRSVGEPEPVTPRRRGRPPKHEREVESVPATPSTPRRARPRKSQPTQESAQEQEQEQPTPRRGRGRPRKSATEAGPSSSAEHDPSSLTGPSTGPAKRRRGRPSASALATETG